MEEGKQITLKQMNERYMAARGLHLIKGDGHDMCVLMPFLLMDAGYQYYCKSVRPVGLAQEARRARNRWRDSYLAFNRLLTSAFTDPDERIAVTDLMDDFEADLANDLLIVQVAGMKCFQDEFDFEEQKVLSAIMMTNNLAVAAQSMWRTMYAGRESNDINGVLQWSKTTAEYYMGGRGHAECLVSQSRVDHLGKCNDILLRKIIRWIERKNEELS